MPLLDVSDLLDDPDFADTLTVTRETETVDSHGHRQTAATQTFADIIGVVTQNSGLALHRYAEGQRTDNTITIHTKFGLTESDIVTWAGRDYTVVNVSDWSRFGAGFVSALCEQKALNP